MKLVNPKIVRTATIAAAGAFAIGSFVSSGSIVAGPRMAHAADEPRVIEIKAKKYEFTPGEITLKKGEPVVLKLSSEDRSHGFLLKPLKIDADIAPGKETDVTVTPDATGDYTVICDHYCGIGHGGMKMKITVVE